MRTGGAHRGRGCCCGGEAEGAAERGTVAKGEGRSPYRESGGKDPSPTRGVYILRPYAGGLCGMLDRNLREHDFYAVG